MVRGCVVKQDQAGARPKQDIKMAPRSQARNGHANAMGKVPASSTESQATAAQSEGPLDPETAKKLIAARAKVHETLGKVALAMSSTPRYRHLPLGDLSTLILDPLINDRIAIATSAKADGSPDTGDTAGIAIWASVSSEVDAKIREQIKEGVFPLRLAQKDWVSGSINWLLDVIAPNAHLATAVVKNFSQVTSNGELHIHPVVSKLIEPPKLRKPSTNLADRPDSDAM